MNSVIAFEAVIEHTQAFFIINMEIYISPNPFIIWNEKLYSANGKVIHPALECKTDEAMVNADFLSSS